MNFQMGSKKATHKVPPIRKPDTALRSRPRVALPSESIKWSNITIECYCLQGTIRKMSLTWGTHYYDRHEYCIEAENDA